MTDILSAICAKIATIGRAIEGINVQGVYDPPPANLQSADLPAMFTWTGVANHNVSALGEGFIETTRRFYVQVAVLPIGQGDPNTRETLVRPLIAAALIQFAKYPHFRDVNFVQKCVIVSDSGVIILPEYGGKYIGFEIALDITYFAPRSFAAGE